MARREEFSVGILTMVGIRQKMTTHTVRVLALNELGQVLICCGTDVPHDADAGFATGCMFIKTDNGAIYYNVGTAAAANFDLQGVVAGGSITVAELAANAVETSKIKDANVTQAKLWSMAPADEATDGDVTLHIADILVGYWRKGACAAPRAITVDTAVNIQAGFNATVGARLEFLLYNGSGENQTITAAAGVTLKGTAVVPTGKTARLTFINTGAGTIDCFIELSA